jgi:hypothetical protein
MHSFLQVFDLKTLEEFSQTPFFFLAKLNKRSPQYCLKAQPEKVVEFDYFISAMKIVYICFYFVSLPPSADRFVSWISIIAPLAADGVLAGAAHAILTSLGMEKLIVRVNLTAKMRDLNMCDGRKAAAGLLYARSRQCGPILPEEPKRLPQRLPLIFCAT